MRYCVFVAILLFLVACQAKKNNQQEQEEWISLFNGIDLTGWTIKMSGFPLGENHKETFVVEDSMIRIKYDKYETFEEAYGHMYFEKPFSWYKIRFDYRFVGEQTPGGATWNVRNSGIMLHSQSAESNEFDQNFPVSVELQLLGGLNEGERTTANVCTPGTAVMMGDTVNYHHCISSTSKTYHGDQWVHVEAIVRGGESMEFVVEGDTVLSFQRPQIGGGFINKQSAWETHGITRDIDMWTSREGEILTEGYIALQAESHPIDFKNIELLDLCGCMDPKAENYKTYYLKDQPESCRY